MSNLVARAHDFDTPHNTRGLLESLCRIDRDLELPTFKYEYVDAKDLPASNFSTKQINGKWQCVCTAVYRNRLLSGSCLHLKKRHAASKAAGIVLQQYRDVTTSGDLSGIPSVEPALKRARIDDVDTSIMSPERKNLKTILTMSKCDVSFQPEFVMLVHTTSTRAERGQEGDTSFLEFIGRDMCIYIFLWEPDANAWEDMCATYQNEVVLINCHGVGCVDSSSEQRDLQMRAVVNQFCCERLSWWRECAARTPPAYQVRPRKFRVCCFEPDVHLHMQNAVSTNCVLEDLSVWLCELGVLGEGVKSIDSYRIWLSDNNIPYGKFATQSGVKGNEKTSVVVVQPKSTNAPPVATKKMSVLAVTESALASLNAMMKDIPISKLESTEEEEAQAIAECVKNNKLVTVSDMSLFQGMKDRKVMLQETIAEHVSKVRGVHVPAVTDPLHTTDNMPNFDGYPSKRRKLRGANDYLPVCDDNAPFPYVGERSKSPVMPRVESSSVVSWRQLQSLRAECERHRQPSEQAREILNKSGVVGKKGDKFEVAAVVDSQEVGGSVLFKVRWNGHSQESWELSRTLDYLAPHLRKAYKEATSGKIKRGQDDALLKMDITCQPVIKVIEREEQREKALAQGQKALEKRRELWRQKSKDRANSTAFPVCLQQVSIINHLPSMDAHDVLPMFAKRDVLRKFDYDRYMGYDASDRSVILRQKRERQRLVLTEHNLSPVDVEGRR